MFNNDSHHLMERTGDKVSCTCGWIGTISIFPHENLDQAIEEFHNHR